MTDIYDDNSLTDTIRAIYHETDSCMELIPECIDKTPIYELQAAISKIRIKIINHRIEEEPKEVYRDVYLVYVLSLDTWRKLRTILGIDKDEDVKKGIELVMNEFKNWTNILSKYTLGPLYAV